MLTSDFNRLIRQLNAQGVDRLPVKEEPFDPEDGGIPSCMLDGEIDDEGMGTWRPAPNTLAEAEVVALFQEFGISPPESLLGYLLADCHLIEQVSAGELCLTLSSTPADNPLGPMHDLLANYELLLGSGYIPVAEMGDQWGPICYKSNSGGAVLWFEMDELLSHSDETIAGQLPRRWCSTLGDEVQAQRRAGKPISPAIWHHRDINLNHHLSPLS